MSGRGKMANTFTSLKYCTLLTLVWTLILLIYNGRYGFSATLSFLPWYSLSNTSLQGLPVSSSVGEELERHRSFESAKNGKNPKHQEHRHMTSVENDEHPRSREHRHMTSVKNAKHPSSHEHPHMTSVENNKYPTRRKTVALTSAKRQCHDVLHNMTKGIWKQRRMTSEEVRKMSLFNKRVRQDLRLPKGLQRPDKKCGNINVSKWIKALCDSEGDTPCCYENHCVNKTSTECACSNCFDLRIPVHAEYSNWLPVDPACKPQNWSVEDICRLLEPSTLYFIGDSFVRHVYTALVMAARGDDVTGAFSPNIPQELRSRCSGIDMYTEKVCRSWLDRKTTVCNGTVTLQLQALYRATTLSTSIHKTVLSLQNKTRSLVFLGVGFHDTLQVGVITKRLLKPLLTAMKSKRLQWPRLVWAPVHQFGMMRTSNTAIDVNMAREFNRRVEEFLTPWGVPVFDTFSLTDNVTSFDGQHYGFGVNRMKVRILLHYLQELKSLGQW